MSRKITRSATRKLVTDEASNYNDNSDTSKASKKRAASRSSSTSKKKNKPQEKNQDLVSKKIRKATSAAKDTAKMPLLFTLDELLKVKLRARPSKRNRSPYVADTWFEEEEREVLTHVPNLNMGGKCVPESTLLVKPARDRKGVKVGPNAVNPKFGTPKCEMISQLLYVDETRWDPVHYPPVWVGAHPSLGERVAEALLNMNLLEQLPPIEKIQRQVTNPLGSQGMRSDFLITHTDGSQRVVEVKTVVDTDYKASTAPDDNRKCLFVSEVTPYRRTAIFPWGSSNQKGPDGEKVVSARAIHHVRQLTELGSRATVLFVVVRGDAQAFRPNHEACPSFAKYLRQARDKGVMVLAEQVSFSEDGTCRYRGSLPIVWP